MCEGGKCVVRARPPHVSNPKAIPLPASMQTDQLITLAIPQVNFTTHKTIPPFLKFFQLSQSHAIVTIPPNPPNSSRSSSSASQFFLFFWFFQSFVFFQFFPIHNPVAMAMAMGVASLALTAPKHALVTPLASTNRGEKQGFLDWFRTAFDKESLSELDDVMAKGNENGKSSNENANSKPTSPPKKVLPPLKKAGFNLFGKK